MNAALTSRLARATFMHHDDKWTACSHHSVVDDLRQVEAEIQVRPPFFDNLDYRLLVLICWEGRGDKERKKVALHTPQSTKNPHRAEGEKKAFKWVIY